MPVSYEGRLVEARFVERPNRFVVMAETEEGLIRSHCPNPGRLSEFLHEGTPFLLRERPDATPDQATRFSVVAAMDGRFHVDSELELGQAPAAEDRDWSEGAWVVLDTQLANRVVDDALAHGRLDEAFGDVRSHTAEPAVDGGRLDFRVGTDAGSWLVEVKSVTLVGGDGSTALFPDAPTERGTRHVRELTERAREGEPAAILFLAMREDVERVAPNLSTDPVFGEALATAEEAGVELIGYRIDRVDRATVALGPPLPVLSDPDQAKRG